MRVLFMGTPDFAVPSLRALLSGGYTIIGVVTQPDRPKGRKRVLTPTPVKEEALTQSLPVFQPEKLREPASLQQIIDLKPDLIVTAAYGQILPKALLDVPQYGCINVHGSLLPQYRGGAPIQRAIMNGETLTGVTIMYMAEGLDTGDMISRVEVAITETDTAGTVFNKLSTAGAELLMQTLPDLLDGQLKGIPQDHEQATYAPNLKREDERIDWHRSAKQIYNQVRGLSPWSGGFTLWNEELLKVWQCRIGNDRALAPDIVPGTVLTVSDEGIEVATGSGTLLLTEIQPAGKKALDVVQFNRGSKLEVGTVFA